MGLDLAFGGKVIASVAPGGFAEGFSQTGRPDELVERSNKGVLVAVPDEVAGLAGRKTFADADDVVGDGGQAVQLRFDQEIRERFALGSQQREIGREVERGGVGLVAEESHAAAEAEIMRESLAFFPGGAVAGEPELPVEIAREFGTEFDQLALIFQPAKHGDIQHHHGVGIGAVEFSQGGVAGAFGVVGSQRGVVDDGDLGRGQIVLVGEDALGDMTVGDDMPAETQRTHEKPGEGLAGAHGADDGGAGQALLDETGVAIRHAAHAEHEIGRGFLGGAQEIWGKPVQMAVEGLERLEGEGLVFGVIAQSPTGTEGQQGDLVAGPGCRGAKENGLSFGAATAEIVLDDENFHCSAKRCGNIYQSMKNPFVNLLVRWMVLALGVMLSTKLVHGIHYDSGTTLAVVVLLLSLFNAVLKPLLMLFTLPFILLSLGIGIWFINALIFYFTGRLVAGFQVDSFGSALWGALIVSLTNMILTRMLIGSPAPTRPSPPRRETKKDDVIDV